jgi:hypothetical protein
VCVCVCEGRLEAPLVSNTPFHTHPLHSGSGALYHHLRDARSSFSLVPNGRPLSREPSSSLLPSLFCSVLREPFCLSVHFASDASSFTVHVFVRCLGLLLALSGATACVFFFGRSGLLLC